MTALSIEVLLVAAADADELKETSGDGLAATQAHEKIAAWLRDLGDGGDLLEMLSAERKLIAFERERYSDDPLKRASLENALTEVADAERMLPLVRDPERYGGVNSTHAHRKHRQGDLPLDDARMFFKGQKRRLADLRKARPTAAERAAVLARERNMLKAERLYTNLQRVALGKGQGRSLGR